MASDEKSEKADDSAPVGSLAKHSWSSLHRTNLAVRDESGNDDGHDEHVQHSAVVLARAVKYTEDTQGVLP